MPKMNPKYCREYRKKKRENKIKKTPKSSTERVREFRARRKLLLNMEIDSPKTHNDDFTLQNNESYHTNITRITAASYTCSELNMKKLSMCRICLTEDGLRLIAGTHLQEMYESLVLYPLVTKDSRPMQICYICCARLQNCYELKNSCLQSEELFTQLINCNVQPNPVPIQLQERLNKKRLATVHRVVLLAIGDVPPQDLITPDSLGTEAPQLFDEVTVKQEDADEATDDRAMEEECDADLQSADSDDDPLSTIKIELEEESPSDMQRESRVSNQRIPEDLTSNTFEQTELALANVEDTKGHSDKSTNEPTSSVSDSNKEQYICDMCQRSFTCKYTLVRHNCLSSDVDKNSLLSESTSKVHTPKYVNRQSYQCDVCSKSFSTKSSFNRHIRVHITEKPYQCNVCQDRFPFKSHLTTHVQSHKGEKPHKCKVCKQAFLHKSALNRHIRKHTGEKPHKCDQCNKAYLRKCDLDAHMVCHRVCSHLDEKDPQ